MGRETSPRVTAGVIAGLDIVIVCMLAFHHRKGGETQLPAHNLKSTQPQGEPKP